MSYSSFEKSLKDSLKSERNVSELFYIVSSLTNIGSKGTCIYIYIYICTCVFIHVHVYLYMCMCDYTYLSIYLLSTSIYMYTYISRLYLSIYPSIYLSLKVDQKLLSPSKLLDLAEQEESILRQVREIISLNCIPLIGICMV